MLDSLGVERAVLAIEPYKPVMHLRRNIFTFLLNRVVHVFTQSEVSNVRGVRC